ncbi:MAG: MarR family winged helix-turn-helix transcriptional regulator [Eubacteriales bacterium]|nr:MarR family winged helix-turn-helix transcriptional regulator [Eubacteriales bacterium]
MDDRFLQFTLAVSRMNKQIQAFKTNGMGRLGLKAAHTTVLYLLLGETEGLRFTEITSRSDLDQALISRTLAQLVSGGLIEKLGEAGRYNALYRLTPKGERQAARIAEAIRAVQEGADAGIDPQELAVFYKVLRQLLANFEAMRRERDTLFARLDEIAGEEKE